MNLFKLALAYLRARALASALQIVLLAIGLAAIVAMLLVTTQIGERVERDTRGIDLVVGAKGSPLQLVLSAVFHVDVPTGNIPYSEAIALRKHPLVRQAIPLALGDSWRGHRIVGTEHALVTLYGAQIAQGALWTGEMEAVIGAQAARAGGADGKPVQIGDLITGAHGLVEGGEAHDEHPYKVVGILAPNGSVIDRLVLVSIASVWDVHPAPAAPAESAAAATAAATGTGTVSGSNAPSPAAKRERHAHGHAHDHRPRATAERSGGAPATEAATATATATTTTTATTTASAPPLESEASREVTAVLVQYASPLGAAQLPRQINSATAMQAASPAIESARLTRLVGVGVDTLRVFAVVLLGAAGLALFITLYSALADRGRDLAMMRVLGASRGTLALLLVLEGLLLCVAGGLLGLALGHGLTEWLGRTVPALQEWALTGWLWAPGEGWLLLLALAIGAVAALLPAVLAYRTDIASVLARG